MNTLKKTIRGYMQLITLFSVTVILVMITFILITIEQHRAYETAVKTFSQIEQILEENQKELIDIQQEYSQTCIHNAETIARIIENDPNIVYDTEELKKLAEITEVDEIHIFDDTGRIFAGTHPEYFNYTFDSGEQMRFFKPMLEDKSLQLVQDITPNTAEKKLMQYSALWSRNGDFIVQVGMEPVNVMKVTRKNELSHIFSLFSVSPEANYYAITADTGEIVGATIAENIGKKTDEIGLSFNAVKSHTKGFSATVNGRKSFCVFKKTGDGYLGRVVLISELYEQIPVISMLLAACLTIIAFVLSYAATDYMDRYVVRKIQDVNGQLRSIADGNPDEIIDIHSSLEFSELSTYLNMMIKSLLDNNKKMSYVLSKANRYIGIYEYNHHMKKVRFTEYIPMILGIDAGEAERLASDYSLFKSFLDNIRRNPVANEPGIYRLNGQAEQYVELEELNEDHKIFGVAVNVTNDVLQRKALEFERDADLLTGLYNRRGLDNKLISLFREPGKLGFSAFVLIDADGLKAVNDTYGHEKGDIYLKNIARMIHNFGPKSSIAARQGGDEFILFLYQYDSEEELLNTIHALEGIQDWGTAQIDETTSVRLSFSLGYTLTKADMSYSELIIEADKKMYENKRLRKKDGNDNKPRP